MKITKPNVVIYSKPGCCLCDKAKATLLKLQTEIPFTLQDIDISQNQALFEKYQYVIPVVAIGENTFISEVSEFSLRQALLNIR